jgi:hypothetical protein
LQQRPLGEVLSILQVRHLLAEDCTLLLEDAKALVRLDAECGGGPSFDEACQRQTDASEDEGRRGDQDELRDVPEVHGGSVGV